MLAYLVALVFAVLSVCGSVEGTFTLDGWDGPVDTPNARRPSGTPQARLFGGKVVIVYQANGQLQYSTSTDGTTFGGVGLVDVVTPYDPALVEATDSITGQSRLILVSAYGPGSNTLGYAVWDGSAFPSTLTNTSLTNVGGEVDAIYNDATGKIVFVYISSKPADADQFWCWSATAVLSNGQLTQIVPYDNLYTGANGGTQCAAGTKSQIATFVNPSTSSITFVQPENYKLGSTGDMYFFTTVDPAQGWSESGLNGRIFPGNSTQPASGLAAVSFTIGEDCADLVAIFYIGSSGALGYTLITQPISNQQSSVFGAAHTVMRTNGATVTFTGPPTAVFAFGKIFLYYMDLNQNPTQVAAIYTTPKL